MDFHFPTRRIVAVVLSILPLVSATANNNLFLPGDAFFPTELTAENLEWLRTQADGKREFVYSSFDGYPMAFCGNAGYQRATFTQVDDAFADNLIKAYEQLRKRVPAEYVEERADGKRKLVETNGIRVLFYSTSFSFPEHKLGLRYNENWVDETTKFGHQRQHVRLCCLLRNPLAVQISWRDAKYVPPLLRDKPDVRHEPNSQPTIVIGEPVKAYVISPYALDDLFRFERDKNRYIYTVDSSGIQELRNRDGKRGPPADDDSPF